MAEYKFSCDLCGSNKHLFCFSNIDRMFPEIDGFFDIYKCKECGLLSLYPQPSLDKLNKHYNSNYSVLKHSKDVDHMKRILTILETLNHYFDIMGGFFMLGKMLLFPFKPFFRTTKVVEDGNFLDVGCGMGHFLFIMKYLGMNPYGVEPGDYDKKFSEDFKLKIIRGDLFEANFDENFFDVITLNHVLEHTPNPAETMTELNRILKKNGYLIIGVPITDSISFKIFGKYWAQIDTPRHLFLFSTNNLKLYAENAGFKVESIRYNSNPTYQFISSFIYFLEQKRGQKINRSIINNLFLNLLLLPISIFLNFIKYGDQCEIIMRKI